MTRRLAPQKYCTRCGQNTPISHRTLCAPCRAKSLANQAQQALIHTKASRIRSEKQRHSKAIRASSRAIAQQIAWMDANNLLPDKRRHDYDQDKATAGRAARRP